MNPRLRSAAVAVLVAAIVAAAAALWVHARASAALATASRASLGLGAVRDAELTLRRALDRRGLPGVEGAQPVALSEHVARLSEAWRWMRSQVPHRAALTVDAALADLEAAEGELWTQGEVPARANVEAALAQVSARLGAVQLALADRIDASLSRLSAARWFGLGAMSLVALTLASALLTEWWSRRRSPGMGKPPSATPELDKFAARVAHDVLSPLQAVSSALDIMGRTTDPEKIQRCQQAGRGSLKRVQRVVEGLVDFARAEAAPELSAHVLVQEVVTEVLDELQSAAEDEHVELKPAQVPPCFVAMEHGVLATVLRHLVRNAIQYMPEKAERWVQVRAIDRNGRVSLEVEDSGSGIPEDQQGRLFEPYVRPKGIKKTGLGLGLATVKRIVEAHGGTVTLQSTVARGSRFVVELPAAAPQLGLADRPPYLT